MYAIRSTKVSTSPHSRRIGNFDVSGGLNLFTDEGYRQQGYNKRFHINGNLTYYQPDMGMKLMNYGLTWIPFQQVRGFLHLALARRGLPPLSLY